MGTAMTVLAIPYEMELTVGTMWYIRYTMITTNGSGTMNKGMIYLEPWSEYLDMALVILWFYTWG